jgi:hypothetical protein
MALICVVVQYLVDFLIIILQESLRKPLKFASTDHEGPSYRYSDGKVASWN